MRTLRVQNISFIYRIPRRNLRINPAVIFCILLSAVLILLPASGSRISGTDAAGAGGMQGAVAVVEGNEPLRVRILTGSFAGSEAEAGIPETAEAAFPQGAKTVKETSRTEANRMAVDSLAKEVLLVRTEAVPKSEVRLAISADSLMRLPPRASYSGKSGQANVSVSRDGDVIAVHASCDSLQILVEYYAGRSETYREAWEEMADLYEAEVKRRSNPVQIFFYGFGTGIVICVLAVILIQKQKKDGG